MQGDHDMSAYQIKPLNLESWPDFERLMIRNNGVWNGCWCMSFHPRPDGPKPDAEQNRLNKQRRVAEGAAHAALVYVGDDCVGWCQFGRPDELPCIKNRRNYQATDPVLPDWRITCFFVDPACRGKGVASAALHGALALIADLGGGIVEGYPEDTEGRKAVGSFLFCGAMPIFRKAGFQPERQIGKHMWVVSRSVASAAGQRGSDRAG